MNKDQIKEEARYLHVEAWNLHSRLRSGSRPDPLTLLEPALFAQILGIEYMELPDLGGQVFSFRGKKFMVAGMLDRQAGRIAVSTDFNSRIVRFTACHEIGHWLLHPDEVMHRDKALDGSNGNEVRPPKEKEADFFAANLLMPEKLVRHYMKLLFEVDRSFIFHATNAHHVSPQHADRLLSAEPDTLERELALARCRSFGHKAFASLADIFRVSDMAMALRLRELALIEWP